MEDRSSRRMRTWCPKWPARGLAANENVCALISMVVRSTAPLHSKTGYIDASPQIRQIDEDLLQRTAAPYIRA